MLKGKFWRWVRNEAKPAEGGEAAVPESRELFLDGVIAEDSWFDDEITPKMFRDELFSGNGLVTLWINSPGGDCFAASQIYTMLMDYYTSNKGIVCVKIDGIAASAASVIAMAGTSVEMSPTAMMMIHNPATVAWGDHQEMERVIAVLNEVKASILNAYEIKTGLSRAKLSHMMDEETWMNARKAVELGFADAVMNDRAEVSAEPTAFVASRVSITNSLAEKMLAKFRKAQPEADKQENTGRSVDSLMDRLNVIKDFI